ncbi:hypothetical protein GCM10017674_75470 [Streptomyces gardneri]|uniref:Uncharacterized protein n=1 Tax=Streptomyces gardneri TaxID=66892 RepID=A0A4Y3RTJ9_9ACTN|nr:hypothetical protein SGA01_56680 [Streptomyces gardneri]GHH21080.1 hypothetical protein GCM10017674_75470 [Streptomyces gardneri]
MADNEADRSPFLTTCPECGENEWREPYPPERGRGRPRVYCSEACQRRARRKFTAPYQPGEDRPCAHCGESFAPRATTGRPPQYCSPSCRQGANQQRKYDDYRAWSQVAAVTARLADLRDDIHSRRTRGSVKELQDLEAELKSLLTVVQYRLHAASLDGPPN